MAIGTNSDESSDECVQNTICNGKWCSFVCSSSSVFSTHLAREAALRVLFVTGSLVGRKEFSERNRVIGPGLCYVGNYDLCVREAVDGKIGASAKLHVEVELYSVKPSIHVINFDAGTARTLEVCN